MAELQARLDLVFRNLPHQPKFAPLVREIGWNHNPMILECCKKHLERKFYLRALRKFGWSKNVLAHRIDNQSYGKSHLGYTSFDKTLISAQCVRAKFAVKNEPAAPDRMKEPVRPTLWFRSGSNPSVI